MGKNLKIIMIDNQSFWKFNCASWVSVSGIRSEIEFNFHILRIRKKLWYRMSNIVKYKKNHVFWHHLGICKVEKIIFSKMPKTSYKLSMSLRITTNSINGYYTYFRQYFLPNKTLRSDTKVFQKHYYLEN